MRWITALMVFLLMLTACSGDEQGILAEQQLPDDVAGLVDATWERFADAFADRLECLAPLSLRLVRNVEDGDARYVAEAARIEIEIPTSPARFPESLAHELGHHLEATSPDHEQMRTAFLAAQGLLDAPGYRGAAWEEVPSEYFAEAVVLLVNGERILHDDVIELTDEAVEIVAHWGRGGS